ncbi:hypothetical protein TanjilG_26526 [Lupinus angustifolius]|uniref:DUF7731 domain-containing protein n=1 Tax=Lupinus angustifolius TaxID=3871 RepID=A0A4P1QPM5_LUPAN|nr:PREDICTED: uncharacterized protein LOC109334038 [Lupinus angustifolius]OIV91673.1 hypothetical protein TanjilG_26526 [Lupinus angustifolius]
MEIILVNIRRWILVFAILYISLIWTNFGNADEDVQETQPSGGFGGGNGVGAAGSGGAAGGGGAGFGDPTEIVSKALLCFNDKYMYSSCEESYRLKENGNLNVPSQKTDEFCEGPCLTETNLVLSCIDKIFSNFIFYNRATIQDIKETVQSACGYGPERGNFNVAEHIQNEESKGLKATSHVLFVLVLILMGRGLFL